MSTDQTMRRISAIASGALAQFRFVDWDANGQVAYPSAQAAVAGVTQESAAAQGEVLALALQDGALVKVEAGAIVAKNAEVSTDATGRVITWGAAVGDLKHGKALEAAGAAGEIITIQFAARGTNPGT